VNDVFLSYAREDRPVAEVLARQLEAAGYSVWWDRDLYAGTDFEQVIGQELATAKAVIVLWSATSVRSGWVRDEAATAMERGVLVPVLLAPDVLPPLGFRSVHCIAHHSRDLSELSRALVRRVANPAKAIPTPAFSARSSLGIGMVEGLVLLVLALGVLAFVWFTPR
jgi:hypothetical protein